jgi:NADH:ubiquinone oxidoreductase subunit 6 (subunit J)
VRKTLLALVPAFLLTVVMVVLIASVPWTQVMEDAGKEGSNQVPIEEVANYTFEDFGFALVILGLLLASAIIAGTFLAKEETE